MKSLKYVISVILLTIIIYTFNSCRDDVNKTKTENSIDKQKEELLKTDYKQFYEELSSKGEWIQVSASELNIDLADNSINMKGNSFIAELLGVKTAYAQFDADMIFVWKPSPDLAVSLNTDIDGDRDGIFDQPGINASVLRVNPYVPYTNGRWLYTDNAGWYFAAATPQEEITSHYGRWVFDPDMGYVWVPGNVWAPAWVDMREDPEYVAWAPLPYDLMLSDNRIIYDDDYFIPDDRYVVIERRYFADPEPVKYMYINNGNNRKVMIKDMRPHEGLVILDNRTVYMGPDINVLRTINDEPIIIHTVNDANVISAAGVDGRIIRTYKPSFTLLDDSRNAPSPGKYMSKTDFVNSGKDNIKLEDRFGKDRDRSGKDLNRGNLKTETNKERGNDKKENVSSKQSKGNVNKGNVRSKGDDNVYKKGNDNKVMKDNYSKGNNKKGNDKGIRNDGQKKGNDKGTNNKGPTNKGSNKKGKR